VRINGRFQAWTIAALVVAASVASRGQGASTDYPQWRGQNRDGAASGFVEPASWSESLDRRWKVDVGEGYATPLVIGESVYTFTRRDGSEVMTALAAATGVVRWRSSYAAPYSPSRAASLHGAWPKATPAFHRGMLFTLGISGIVTAFDATGGRILWQTAAPSEPPFFGAASSPVVENGLVIVNPGNYEPLTAFDVTTGAVKWRAGEGGFFASPIVASLAGIRQAIAVTQKSVIGVSIADGRVLWRYPWAGDSGGTMPVLYQDMVIVSGLNVGVEALRPMLRDGNWAVERVWQTKEVWMYLSNPVVMSDTLFGLSQRSSGQYFALDAATGRTLWLGSPRQAANTAIVKARSVLFLLNDDGELIVARSSRTGFDPLRRYRVAESATWAQPVISGRRLFVKDVSSLMLWALP
jgi:outer membrane protein assembly factor BamB